LALDGAERSPTQLDPLDFREKEPPGVSGIGGWVGPEGRLSDLERSKISFPCRNRSTVSWSSHP